MSTEDYTIIVNGQQFVVTRDQLESEPGNYFASYFLGDFEEAANNTRELRVEKEPLLFKLIQAHLRGYKIFPIPDAYIPDYMTRRGALENILLDAQYFSMTRLEGLVKSELEDFHEPTIKRNRHHPEQRIYQIGWHDFRDQPSSERAASQGLNRNFTPLSLEGLERLEKDHVRVLPNCAQCHQVTKGWELVAFLREKGTVPGPRLHFVVESRLV